MIPTRREVFIMSQGTPELYGHEQLEIMRKNRAKIIKIEDLIIEHNSLIIHYCSIWGYNPELPLPITLPFLLNVFSIFNKMVCLRANPRITSKTINEMFNYLSLPISDDKKLETQIIDSVKKILLSCDKSMLYDFCLTEYRVKFQNLYYNHAVFDHPKEYFILFEGNIFCKNVSSTFWHNDKYFYQCLCSQNIKNWFVQNSLPLASCAYLKRLFSLLKPYLSSVSSDADIKNPYSLFVVDIKNTLSCIYYDGARKSLGIEVLDTSKHSANEKGSHLYNASLTDKIRPSKNLAYLLYLLSDGNLLNFDRFAMTIACIASPTLLEKKLFLIRADSNRKEFLYFFITSIFNKMDNTSDTPIIHPIFAKDLINTKNIPELLNLTYLGHEAFLIENCSALANDTDIKAFKKILAGKSVVYNDKYMGKIQFKNKLPILCITDSHREYVYLKNNYNCCVMDFNHLKNVDIGEYINLAPDDRSWLQSYLIFHGMKLIAERALGIASIPKEQKLKLVIKHDEILDEFIKTCCTTKTDAKVFTYADELHAAYSRFYALKYGNSPLQAREFNRKLKSLGLFEYKRPHASRKLPSKWAFMGLEVNAEFLDNLSATSAKDAANSPTPSIFEIDAFSDKLLNITESIYNDLYPSNTSQSF